MSTDRPAPLLGRLAVHLKMIGMEQLAELTREQAREGGTNLGELMLSKGVITRLQLDKLLQAQKQVIAKQRAKQQADAAVAAADPEPEVAAAPAAAGTPATSTGGAGADELAQLLRLGVERHASDIHIHSGVPLRVRLHGRFELLGEDPLSPERAEALTRAALTPEQRSVFDERGELDFAYTVAGLGRFRVNAYRGQRGTDSVFRHIPPEAPTLDELGLPGDLARYTNYHQGMVLITGPANCGKSSTLAALVRILNEERRDHILTIEDPIEYVHPSNRCVVNQRNVGPHTESFARALRAALREDPDVIVIGELRDLETISLALTAAETGHLVLGTDAHQQHHPHPQPADRGLPGGPAGADPQHGVGVAAGGGVPAPGADGGRPAAGCPALESPGGQQGHREPDPREQDLPDQLAFSRPARSQGMCLLDDSLNPAGAAGTWSAATRPCCTAEDPKRIGG